MDAVRGVKPFRSWDNVLSRLQAAGNTHGHSHGGIVHSASLRSEFSQCQPSVSACHPKHQIPTTIPMAFSKRVHHARKVREWVKKNHEKIELFFRPPYCPEINPDEYLNNTVKAQLRRKLAPRSHEQLQQDLRNRMKSNQRKPHLIKKLFEHPAVRYAAA